MNTHPNMECVRIRPYGEVADDNHQVTVNRVRDLFGYSIYGPRGLGAYGSRGLDPTGAYGSRGLDPYPSPRLGSRAMALAPPSNSPHTFPKHHYDIKLLWSWWKTRYGFETLSALIFISGVEFIEVHGPDGQRAFLNPKAISSLREPIATDLKGFTKGVRCVVVTTNGKFIAVVETCTNLRDILDKKP